MNTTFPSRLLRSALGLLLLSSLLLGSFTPALAAGRCYVNASAIGMNSGASWTDAYIDLQSAIGNTACSVIWVAKGVYKPTAGTDRLASFNLRNNLKIYGGFDGTETLISQRKPSLNLTVLSGDISLPLDNTDNSFHVVRGSAVNRTALLDGFTIRDGNANDLPGQGGGLYNITGSSPTLANLVFRDNAAIDKGGAMYNELGIPALTNVLFAFNSAHQGGAMYNNSSNPVLKKVTFRNNKAETDAGGAMYNFSSNPTLTGVSFTGNYAVSGGAIYNEDSNPTLTGGLFKANRAISGGFGGAIYNHTSSPAISKLSFIRNTAGSGGAVYNYLNSNPTFTTVTFSRNITSDQGGAMFNANSSPLLTTVTFTGNSAANFGGGIYNLSSSPSLTSVTFSANSATRGGGLWNDAGSNPGLTKVTFTLNKASEAGGGLFNNGGNPALSRVTFTSNTAASGGGMANASAGTPSLRDVSFISNTALDGAGLWSEAGNPVLLNVTFRLNAAGSDGGGFYNSFSNSTLTNVTFSANTAAQNGGAIYNSSGGSTLTNVTISGNTAAFGGAIYNTGSSTPVITNSILYGDTGGEITIDTGLPVVTYSIVQGSYPGVGNLDLDPMLKKFGNYGGPTKTMPLKYLSPAVDTGSDLACPAADQRGIARPQDGDGNGIATCDMGATESRYGTLVFESAPAEDGWILELSQYAEVGGSMDNTALTFNLGDDRYDRQFRSILSFNTSSLPDKSGILSATLQILKAGQAGSDPFSTNGDLLADVRKGTFSGNKALEIKDFEAASSRLGAITIPNTPVLDWYSGVMTTSSRRFVNKTGLTQFRLRFTLDDNNDHGNDYLKFYSGNSVSGNRPLLTIVYYAP